MYNSDKNPNNSNKTALNSEQKEDKTRRKQLAKERGARLKQALRAKGLTQAQVANDLQRRKSGLNYLLAGNGLISPTLAYAIEHLYCIGSEWVLSGKGAAHTTNMARILHEDLLLETARSETLHSMLDNCEWNVKRLRDALGCEEVG